jgi:hypothetical protein
MSGVASIVLLLLATFWQLSYKQGRIAVLLVSAVCFVIGAYRVWVAEHRRWLALTGKTRAEFFADTIAEFTELERWYGSDERTERKPLDSLFEQTIAGFRYHVPEGPTILVFKDAATNRMSMTESHLPLGRDNRTIVEIGNWRADEEREICWRTVSAFLFALKRIRREIGG